MDKRISDIIDLIDDGYIHQGAADLKELITEKKLFSLMDTVESAHREYDLMLQFMEQGFNDPKRLTLLEGVKQKLINMARNADRMITRQTYHFFSSKQQRIEAADFTIENIRHTLENYVAESTMASIDPSVDVEQLYDDHHNFVSLLFVYISCSLAWSQQERKGFVDLCTSPTIDQRDQQLIVSAIMLSCLNSIDEEKWLALTDIYVRATDEDVKQRALVGWVVSLIGCENCSKNVEARISELCLDTETVDAILQMQMEMLFCSNAEKDQKTINEEIVPGILKSQNYSITPGGLVENNDDEIEDILHPEKVDERMEETQKFFDRIQLMQKQGADIYFSGFSQMKRFSFFYNIANWFMPFYEEHPEMVRAMKGKESIPMVLKIVENVPLCNSDRYSFILGVSSVINTLPQDVAHALRSGELAERAVEANLEKRSRLLYLQDMYRYAKLFHETKLYDADIFQRLIVNEPWFIIPSIEERLPELMKAIHKAGFTKQLDEIIYRHLEWGAKNREFMLVNARRNVEKKHYQLAFLNYTVVEITMGFDPSVEKATAKVAMLAGFYNEAAKRYRLLLKKNPDSLSCELNYCYAQVCAGEAEKVVDQLFRIEFQSFESGDAKLMLNAQRALALALISLKRYDDGLKRYNTIINDSQSTLMDQNSLGMALWMSGKTAEAVNVLAEYCKELAKAEGCSYEDAVENMYEANCNLLPIYDDELTADDMMMLVEIITSKV